VHAWIIGGNVDKLTTLVLAAVCAWGVAYILINISVVLLRIRRPDLPRPYKAPFFPLPQIISTGGILVAIWYITPLGTSSMPVYKLFGIMFGLVAVYAFVWTRFVRKVDAFTPVPVEHILAKELDASPGDK
jgi:amino acid transporter